MPCCNIAGKFLCHKFRSTQSKLFGHGSISVPDRRIRNIPEVVLVRRWAVGFWEFGRGGFGWRVGQGWVSLQATWDRGGRFLSQLGGFQVSRRGTKGKKGEVARGIKSKGSAPCINVYCNSHSCIYWNDWIDERYQLCIIIIIIGMKVVENLNSV